MAGKYRKVIVKSSDSRRNSYPLVMECIGVDASVRFQKRLSRWRIQFNPSVTNPRIAQALVPHPTARLQLSPGRVTRRISITALSASALELLDDRQDAPETGLEALPARGQRVGVPAQGLAVVRGNPVEVVVLIQQHPVADFRAGPFV